MRREKIFSILFLSILVLIIYYKAQNYKQQDESIQRNDKCLPNKHSVCFINKIFCHPGYTGKNCDIKLEPANPWYTSNCPNLNKDITYDVNTPLSDLSNGKNCKDKNISGITGCAHLCIYN